MHSTVSTQQRNGLALYFAAVLVINPYLAILSSAEVALDGQTCTTGVPLSRYLEKGQMGVSLR